MAWLALGPKTINSSKLVNYLKNFQRRKREKEPANDGNFFDMLP